MAPATRTGDAKAMAVMSERRINRYRHTTSTGKHAIDKPIKNDGVASIPNARDATNSIGRCVARNLPDMTENDFASAAKKHPGIIAPGNRTRVLLAKC